MTRIDPAFAVPYPDAAEQLAREASSFLADARDPAVHDRPTICEPWTVLDLVRHLAATFERFNLMLDRARDGVFDPPFEPGDLDAENLRAVEAFAGEPLARFETEVWGFLDRLDDPAEPMGHQRGIIPVSLQTLFGLADVAIHHWDLTLAVGAAPYRPAADVPALLVPAFRALGASEPQVDTWEWLVQTSGRTT